MNTNCQPNVVIDELNSVVNDIYTFLQGFVNRFEMIAQEIPASYDILNSDYVSAETWDNKRLLVEHRIREQVELLTNAWLRLEEEQRTLLETKKGFDNVAKKNTAGSIGYPIQGLPGTSHFSINTQQTAVDEFERMRREIQTNRPNIKAK